MKIRKIALERKKLLGFRLVKGNKASNEPISSKIGEQKISKLDQK